MGASSETSMFVMEPPQWKRGAAFSQDHLDNSLESNTASKRRFLRGDAANKQTCISDLPELIMVNIFSSISDPRTRNSMSVVCRDWFKLERATRTTLCLRANNSDLYLVPTSFQEVVHLDLSQCSPWGHSLFQPPPAAGLLIGQLLKKAFPNVRDITVYVRDAVDIELIAFLWPDLESVKLVRWHQRAMQPEEAAGLGMELRFLMQNCKMLKHLDLSEFFCWTEDIPPALEAEPRVSSNLRHLNLLKISTDGFKASELATIANACPSLEEFLVICVFDSRYLDFIGDDALLVLARNCPKLRILHLIDESAFAETRGEPNEGFASQDAQISQQGLEGMFQALPFLEDLAIVLSQDMRDTGPVLESLASHCKTLKSLKLGRLHGVCRGPQPDGLAMCVGLSELVIKHCADLTDSSLAAIGKNCRKLCKLGLHSCKLVSRVGLRTCANYLLHSLVEVEVSCCLLLDSAATLWALEPIQATIWRLHLDCIWDTELVKEEEEKATQLSKPPHSTPELEPDTIRCRNGSIGCNALGVEGLSGRDDPSIDAQERGWSHRLSNSSERTLFGVGVSDNRKASPPETQQSEDMLSNGSGEGWLTMSSNPDLPNISKQDSERTYKGDLGSLMTLGCRGGLDFDALGEKGLFNLNCVADSVLDSDESILELQEPNDSSLKEALATSDLFGPNDCESGAFRSNPGSELDKCVIENHDQAREGFATCVFRDLEFIMNGAGEGTSNSGGELDNCVIENHHQAREGFMNCVFRDSEFVGNSAGEGTIGGGCLGQSLTQSLCASDSEGSHGCAESFLFKNKVSYSFRDKDWRNLKSLSLWIPVGELITPLPIMGLRSCPSLCEVKITVEGDCRTCPKPKARSCGLSTFASYPALSKLVLNCSEAVGYALSAPEGHMDLSLWERWYLNGMRTLGLWDLDYWPPQDKEMNRRGLSLVASGLLSECAMLRKLSVHGTCNEHLMRMFLNSPNLRDLQLRIDYYPAPEDDLNTEMRSDSCKRFEAALAARGFPD